MKKYQKWGVLLLVGLVFLLLFILPGEAAAFNIQPQIGEYAIGQPPAGEKKTLLELIIPVKETGDDWQLSASYAWFDKETEKWILVPQQNYAIPTKRSCQDLVGNFYLNKEVEWYWLRIWGSRVSNRVSNPIKHWLAIDDKDEFCRRDIEGRPGYEMIIDVKEGGKSIVVPCGYDKRP